MMVTSHYVETADRQQVAFDHYQYGHNKVVIIAPGFYNSKAAVLLKALGNELGKSYDVIIMDFRGHGQSSGLFNWTSKEHLDLQAVLDAAGRSYGRIGVIGFSLGGASSIIVASKTSQIQSLIAISPPSDFWRIEYNLFKLDFENDVLFNLFGGGRRGKGVRPGPFWLNKERPVDCMGRVQAPTMFIHGDKDWLIHPRHTHALYAQSRCLKQMAIIRNGPHAEYLIRKNRQETLSLIRDWFNRTL